MEPIQLPLMPRNYLPEWMAQQAFFSPEEELKMGIQVALLSGLLIFMADFMIQTIRQETEERCPNVDQVIGSMIIQSCLAALALTLMFFVGYLRAL
jgi:hypothetical protein